MRARCEAAALSQGSFGLRGLCGDDGGEYRGGSVVVSFWWLGRWLGAVVVECGWGGSVVGSIMVVWWCVCGGAAARMSQEEARATAQGRGGLPHQLDLSTTHPRLHHVYRRAAGGAA
eukprot:scaffold98258_cov118-Phaeocystis_antarctica.AAC.1